ncbi:MAG: hypothetical protein QM831_21605 [Kofleriaceae bacterium]
MQVEVTAKASVFAKICGPRFTSEPIDQFHVVKPTVRDLATLRRAKHLAKVGALVFLEPIRLASNDDVTALAEFLPVLHVRSLELRLAVNDEVAIATRDVLANLTLPVRSLKLGMRSVRAGAIASGLATAKLPNLTSLSVHKYAVNVLRDAFPNATVDAIVE